MIIPVVFVCQMGKDRCSQSPFQFFDPSGFDLVFRYGVAAGEGQIGVFVYDAEGDLSFACVFDRFLGVVDDVSQDTDQIWVADLKSFRDVDITDQPDVFEVTAEWTGSCRSGQG